MISMHTLRSDQKSILAAILFIAATLVACQPTPAPALTDVPYVADSGSLAVRCGVLIDGLADDGLNDRLVVIRDGRTTDVLPGSTNPPTDIAFLDLSDHTCLPGLIDTHVHIALLAEDAMDMSVYYRRPLNESINIARQNSAATLLAGFTMIRNIGDYFPQAVYAIDDSITSGAVIGPRIQNGGPWLTIPGGGGDLVIPGYDESEIPAMARLGVARGPDEFRAAAERAVADGAQVLKMIASGAVFAFGGVPGAPEMTPEEIAAVVDVARRHGLRTTAHAHGAQSIKDAILAGADAIEHASLADDEAIELAAERQVAFSMDVYNGTYTEEVGYEQNYPEEFMRKNYETTEAQRVVFEKAFKAGVPILYGTDAGVLPHGLNARQFAIMVQRAMPPMAAIKSATSVAAEHMDLSGDVGAVDAGRYGDLIAVRGNPLEEISILENVDVVVKGGMIFKLP
jgi:imidazolonepropionase-like amidohydrolase